MTVFAQDTQLVVPFVTVPAFKAHPTYLDLSNLRSGDTNAPDQDAELLNILLMASACVESECDQPIQAHIQTDNRRLFVDKYGRLHIYPDHAPVRTVLSYSYQTGPGAVANSISTPNCWIEDGRQVTIDLSGATITWSGPLQFGTPAAPSELFTSMTYVAGYTNTVLTNSPIQGATSIQVANPTGIFPGDVLRIWEPGKEESVVVASNYTPVNVFPYSATTVQLASGTANAHTAGAGVTGFDADLMLATIYYAVDGLQRWGTSSSDWPGARVRAATRRSGAADMSHWEEKAARLLATYRRVR